MTADHLKPARTRSHTLLAPSQIGARMGVHDHAREIRAYYPELVHGA